MFCFLYLGHAQRDTAVDAAAEQHRHAQRRDLLLAAACTIGENLMLVMHSGMIPVTLPADASATLRDICRFNCERFCRGMAPLARSATSGESASPLAECSTPTPAQVDGAALQPRARQRQKRAAVHCAEPGALELPHPLLQPTALQSAGRRQLPQCCCCIWQGAVYTG